MMERLAGRPAAIKIIKNFNVPVKSIPAAA
jgi:hypothetical protein